jgi:lysophospholipase L1-like esterase
MRNVQPYRQGRDSTAGAFLLLFAFAAVVGCGGSSSGGSTETENDGGAGSNVTADGSTVTPGVDSGGQAPDAESTTPDSGGSTVDSGEAAPDSGEVTVDSGGPGGGTEGGSAPDAGSITDNVPATAANRALCTSVPQTKSAGGATVCPGGGPGPNCYECLFGGDTYNSTDVANAQGTQEAGNYAVTVDIGGAAAGQTQLDAEANRIMLASTATTAGQILSYQFMINVRAKEGQPQEDVAAGYPGLDLYFSGTMSTPPQVSAIGYALASTAGDKPVMVYVASDSTACDQTNTDYAGWGQMLPEYFKYPVDIANYADSGESSGSFLNGADRWGAVDGLLASGDWVLIQFGHNDGNTSSSAFQANITKMVTEAKAKGATPILVSPPARATFTGSTLDSQSSLHAADMQAVATAQKLGYIDLTAITSAWYTQLGSNGWQIYHAVGSPGASPDKTHTNAAGAIKIAGFVTTALASQKLGPYTYLR